MCSGDAGVHQLTSAGVLALSSLLFNDDVIILLSITACFPVATLIIVQSDVDLQGVYATIIYLQKDLEYTTGRWVCIEAGVGCLLTQPGGSYQNLVQAGLEL